ncbi:hypothetical protein ACFSTI_26100 [Rhizorhabdus histidinilytica]|uniref:hypothetical protein n=1 Tax=Rhizorhabdus histidinilytica TaxID=439228 RepID=UPI000F76B981|nr:hypothetical protein EIK56_09160 [Sphingomonas sp. C8-2]
MAGHGPLIAPLHGVVQPAPHAGLTPSYSSLVGASISQLQQSRSLRRKHPIVILKKIRISLVLQHLAGAY